MGTPHAGELQGSANGQAILDGGNSSVSVTKQSGHLRQSGKCLSGLGVLHCAVGIGSTPATIWVVLLPDALSMHLNLHARQNCLRAADLLCTTASIALGLLLVRTALGLLVAALMQFCLHLWPATGSSGACAPTLLPCMAASCWAATSSSGACAPILLPCAAAG